MAIDFPNSPATNDTFTAAGSTWVWNGFAWVSVAGTTSAFSEVAVSGQSTVSADTSGDTLTLASSDLAITTNASTDTVSLALTNVNSSSGSFGDSVTVPVITVNAKGLTTASSSVSIRLGSTSQTGLLQLTDSISSTSTTTAATPAAVKTAYDLANAALARSGGTMTGSITLRAGTATAGTAPLYLAAGTNLTAAAAGAVEWDGTSLYLTQTTGPTRKTVAYTDSNITGTASNVTGTVAVLNGGTGQTSYLNGELLIGNTTGNTLAKATLTGTTDQVVVTNGAGSVTLSLPQSIATSSSPTFAALIFPNTTATGIRNTANTAFLYLDNASGNSLWKTKSGGGAFIDADTLTIRDQTGATTRVAVASTGVTVSNGGLTLDNATGPQLTLNGATSNWISFPATGLGAPTFTTRSVGTRIVMWPEVSASAADYAIGMEGAALWFSASTTSAGFKWYSGTTNTMTLTGGGALSVTGSYNVSSTTVDNIRSQGTGAGYQFQSRNNASTNYNTWYRFDSTALLWDNTAGANTMSVSSAGTISSAAYSGTNLTISGTANLQGTLERNGTTAQAIINVQDTNSTSNLTLTSTTHADLAGATITLSCQAGDTVLIYGFYHLSVTSSGGAGVGRINVGGSLVGNEASFSAASGVAPTGGGFTCFYKYTHSGATANVIFKLQGRLTAGATTNAAAFTTQSKIMVQHLR